jgi:hypothetical protein
LVSFDKEIVPTSEFFLILEEHNIVCSNKKCR